MSVTDEKKDYEAGIAVAESSGTVGGMVVTIDPEAERRLLRKLDMIIMPIFTFVYLLAFLDKVNVGNAASNGLATSLGLGTFDFNIGTSLYYVVYMTLDIPAALLVKRVGTWILPVSMLGFGIVTLGTAFIQTRAQFFGVRCALAFTEMPILPGLSYICTKYYRRSEMTMRLCSFYLIGAGLAQAFGSLLASAFFSIPNVGTVKGWRVLFLCEGIITIGLIPLLYLVFPAEPSKTKYLTESERELALARIIADQPDAQTAYEPASWSLIRKSFNLNTLACIWIFICSNITVQGLAIFTTSILKINYPGVSAVHLQLLAVPPPVVSVVFSLAMAYWAMKYNKHGLAIIISATLAVIGYGIWVGTDTTSASARYAALFLNSMAGYGYGSIVVGWALSNSAPDTVRAVVAAALPGFGDIGGFAGVWGYISTDASTGYRIGNIMNLVTGSSVILTTAALLAYQRWENQKREQGHRDDRLERQDVAVLGSEHPSFRYIH